MAAREATMKTALSVIAGAAILCGSFVTAKAQSDGHVVSKLQEAQWGPAPPVLPAGAEIAVLAGNPMGNGPYSVRLKFPANYAIPAHSHPTDENVVVVSGTVYMGMGDKLDKGTGHAIGVGGFAMMPANANPFAYTAAETTIILYGQGPVEFKYVNPKDD